MYNKSQLSRDKKNARKQVSMPNPFGKDVDYVKPIVSQEGFKQGPPPADSKYRIMGEDESTTLYNPTPYAIAVEGPNGSKDILNPFDTTLRKYNEPYMDEEEYEDGGEYMDLTQEEIEQYRAGGYVVDDLSQQDNGGVYSQDIPYPPKHNPANSFAVNDPRSMAEGGPTDPPSWNRVRLSNERMDKIKAIHGADALYNYNPENLLFYALNKDLVNTTSDFSSLIDPLNTRLNRTTFADPKNTANIKNKLGKAGWALDTKSGTMLYMPPELMESYLQQEEPIVLKPRSAQQIAPEQFLKNTTTPEVFAKRYNSKTGKWANIVNADEQSNTFTKEAEAWRLQNPQYNKSSHSLGQHPAVSFQPGGGVKPYVTSDINKFKFRKAAYDDSLSLYNQGIKDRDNYVSYLYKNGFDVKNHLARWNTNGYVNTDKHPTIGAIYNGVLENIGGGFNRDNRGVAHNYTTYPLKNGNFKNVYDNSPEGKILGKRYSVYKKPTQPVQFKKPDSTKPQSSQSSQNQKAKMVQVNYPTSNSSEINRIDENGKTVTEKVYYDFPENIDKSLSFTPPPITDVDYPPIEGDVQSTNPDPWNDVEPTKKYPKLYLPNYRTGVWSATGRINPEQKKRTARTLNLEEEYGDKYSSFQNGGIPKAQLGKMYTRTYDPLLDYKPQVSESTKPKTVATIDKNLLKKEVVKKTEERKKVAEVVKKSPMLTDKQKTEILMSPQKLDENAHLAYQKEPEQVKAYTPTEQNLGARAMDIVYNPMTSIGYLMRNQQIPDNLQKRLDYGLEDRNPLDIITDVTPIGAVHSLQNIYDKATDDITGNFWTGNTALDALNILPTAKLLRSGLKGFRPTSSFNNPAIIPRLNINPDVAVDFGKQTYPVKGLVGLTDEGLRIPEGNSYVRSGLGGMDMSRYEIKNPDYFTQLLNTYDSKALSSSNKKFYKDLIESVKKQEGLVTERQYNELQRLKTGNFNFGKKAYDQGGSYVDNQITHFQNGGVNSPVQLTPYYSFNQPESPEAWAAEIKNFERQIGHPTQWTFDDHSLLQNKLNEYKEWRSKHPEVRDLSNKPDEYIIPLPYHLRNKQNGGNTDPGNNALELHMFYDKDVYKQEGGSVEYMSEADIKKYRNAGYVVIEEPEDQ